MNKVFLAVASMICTHFVMKVYDKVTQEPTTKKEIYYRMKKAEWELRKRAEHDAIQAHIMQNHLSAVRNQQDGSRLMNAIGTVGDLEPVMGGY
jgi:hypothetical protein